MKKIALLLILVSGIILIDACKKVETDPNLDMSKAVKSIITEPTEGGNYILLEENDTVEINFTWTAASYFPEDLALPFYVLQMVEADSSYDGAKKLISTTATVYTTTVNSLNNTLLGLGLKPDESTEMKFRVNSSLHSYDDGKVIEGTLLESDVVTASFTPYESTVPPPEGPDTLWVPGDYQGWNPGGAPNVYSHEHNGIYTGYIFYPEGGSFEFKFTSAPDWDHTNFGNGGDGILDTDSNAGNLIVPGTGNYWLTADTVGLTWGYELQNYALIGTFNDWDGDEPLTWDDGNQMWTVTMDFDAAAEFKWRANSAWDYNFGINDPDDGKVIQGGGNIVISAAGNYTVNLYLNEAFPRYELIAN